MLSSKLLSRTLAALMAACLMAACSDGYWDYQQERPRLDVADRYINLTIAVSSGNSPATRAGEKPAGGENGDGREAGFERENEVTGITVVIYDDADNKGINTASDASVVKFVKYYTTTKTSVATPGTQYGDTKHEEAVYTTGDKLLPASSGLDYTKTYKLLVIANANVESEFPVNSKINEKRDAVTTAVYNGAVKAADAKNFVMTSETDATLDFPSKETKDGINTYYRFEDIRVERLAARIDFWAEGSNGYKTEKDSKSYTTPGFEYSIPGTSAVFVVTKITPFNMNNGSEYYFKRTDDSSDKYLHDETTGNWVVDPNTSKKDGTPTYTGYDGKLADTFGTPNPHTNTFSQAVKDYYTTDPTPGFKNTNDAFKLSNGTDDYDNLVIAYPKENTLLSTSPLKLHATGVAIQGDYYADGDASKTPVTRVYYGYLRHQGEKNTAYDDVAMATSESTMAIFDDAKVPQTCGTNVMNFGIVRNNIYRLSIEMKPSSSTELELKLKIKVKKWDEFLHDYIYM